MKSHVDFKEQKAVKILISPSDNGFNCSIDLRNLKNLNADEIELCNTIARGLVYQATTDPHATFLMGMKGIDNDKKKDDFKIKKNKKKNNVINFYDYYRNRICGN